MAYPFLIGIGDSASPGYAAFNSSRHQLSRVARVAYAREHGGYTIGWTGFSGGRLARMCHLSIHIPSTTDEHGPIEGLFSHLAHTISGYLAMKRGLKLTQVD